MKRKFGLLVAAVLALFGMLAVSPTPALAVDNRSYSQSCSTFNSDLGTYHTFKFRANVNYYGDNTAVVNYVEATASGQVAAYDMTGWNMSGVHYKSVAGTTLWTFNNDYVYNSNPEVRQQATSGWHSTIPDSHAFSITFKAKLYLHVDQTCSIYLSFG